MLIYVFGTDSCEEELEIITENDLYNDLVKFADEHGFTHCTVYDNIGCGYRGNRLCEFNFDNQ